MQQHYDDMTEVLTALSTSQGDLTDVIADNHDTFE